MSDRARLLARGTGYTSLAAAAMRDEPEAVDEHALAGAGRTAGRAERQRFDELLDQRAQRPAEDRLRLVRADAARRGVPIGRHLHVIEQRLAALERAVYRPVDRAA